MSPQNAAVPPVAKEQTDLDFEHSKQKLGTASVVGIFETRSWLGKKNTSFLDLHLKNWFNFVSS
jgi:hypothetical protein